MVRRGVICLLILAGCGSARPEPADADALFFPRHDLPLGVGDAALLEGALVEEDLCLWVVAEGARFLVLWPSDTQPEVGNGEVLVRGPGGELLAETGSIVRLGGSGTDRASAESAVGPIPERCADAEFWAVSTVG